MTTSFSFLVASSSLRHVLMKSYERHRGDSGAGGGGVWPTELR